MANVPNNQRFRSTERRLEAAALYLMEHGERRLSVRAICERAGVNRSTFYAHFTDVPEMVGRMEDELGEELYVRYLTADGAPRGEVPLSAASFVPFLEHIRTHRSFYRIALATRRDFPLERGRERMWDEVVVPLCRAAGIEDEERMTCLFVFYQAGFTMVLRRWVDGGCETPIDEMAETLALCVPAAWRKAVA